MDVRFVRFAKWIDAHEDYLGFAIRRCAKLPREIQDLRPIGNPFAALKVGRMLGHTSDVFAVTNEVYDKVRPFVLVAQLFQGGLGVELGEYVNLTQAQSAKSKLKKVLMRRFETALDGLHEPYVKDSTDGKTSMVEAQFAGEVVFVPPECWVIETVRMLLEQNGELPTKGEVQQLYADKKDRKLLSKRKWNEVWKAAGLDGLAHDKPHTRATKNATIEKRRRAERAERAQKR
ncbi:hypothetical protein BGE01nite_49320 [Brevifollis gellanilyticus]|uniref:Uncharacterized protein n=2 Tax=Brevifollis gellanilyticus TaxID=748831 RepID=A0A512MH13_9BACT|nr:hypothetical protein BGE01nite_49320 [Brevifollis gellanilyticus]